MSELNHHRLQEAAADFLFLLDRGYPRAASLQLVGNRYNLEAGQRQLLHRGVFAREDAQRRQGVLVPAEQLANERLLVDGHNVLITTESALAGRPLVAANDGVIRDVAGISHRYRFSSLTRKAIALILGLLHQHPPSEVLFLLDAPICRSGELAGILRAALRSWDLAGGAEAVRVPEKWLVGTNAIVASSDSVVLDRVESGFDLAGAVIHSLPQAVELIDFSSIGAEG